MIEIKKDVIRESYTDDYIYYVNNDPLVAPPNHIIIRDTLEYALRNINGSTIKNDFQAIAGPGALTKSIARFFTCLQLQANEDYPTIEFIDNWSKYSYPDWTLEYRRDNRNWRLWDGKPI